MLPYLGAIGLISTSELSPTGRVLALTGYVVLMGVPALGLLWVRLALHDRVEARLRALASRLTRHTGTALWWVIGILGFLLATDAVRRLGLWGS